MTSDERKTLEALHDAPMTSIPAMDAIRSALAEVDALTKQVADLEHADKCHAKFYARLCDALHIPEPHAVDGDVFDAIADLEARAIPKAWAADALSIYSDRADRSDVIEVTAPGDVHWSWDGIGGHGSVPFLTLSDALAAAAKERP